MSKTNLRKLKLDLNPSLAHAVTFAATATVFIENIRIALQPPAAPHSHSIFFPSGPSPVLTSTDSATDETAYRLATSPTDPASVSRPSIQVSGLNPQPSFLLLSLLRARSDLTYTVEASTDLATWTTLATDPGSVSSTTLVTVTDSADLSATPRRFLRLRVSSP